MKYPPRDIIYVPYIIIYFSGTVVPWKHVLNVLCSAFPWI